MAKFQTERRKRGRLITVLTEPNGNVHCVAGGKPVHETSTSGRQRTNSSELVDARPGNRDRLSEHSPPDGGTDH